MPKSKVTQAHQTLIDAARRLREVVEPDKRVKRIVAGAIRRAGPRCGAETFKVEKQNGCLKVQARGVIAIQTVRLYCDTKDLAAVCAKVLALNPASSARSAGHKQSSRRRLNHSVPRRPVSIVWARGIGRALDDRKFGDALAEALCRAEGRRRRT